MNKKSKGELLRAIRHGRRLRTKSPKTEVPKTVYTRKSKHKRRDDYSSCVSIRFSEISDPRSACSVSLLVI